MGICKLIIINTFKPDLLYNDKSVQHLAPKIKNLETILIWINTHRFQKNFNFIWFFCKHNKPLGELLSDYLKRNGMKRIDELKKRSRLATNQVFHSHHPKQVFNQARQYFELYYNETTFLFPTKLGFKILNHIITKIWRFQIFCNPKLWAKILIKIIRKIITESIL